MSKISCYFTSCLLQYHNLKLQGKYEELRKMKLYHPPLDPDLFEKWRNVIPYSEKEFTKNDLLCDLHFTPEDYIPDDRCTRVATKKPLKLKEDAIPSIFYEQSNFQYTFSEDSPNNLPIVRKHTNKDLPDLKPLNIRDFIRHQSQKYMKPNFIDGKSTSSSQLSLDSVYVPDNVPEEISSDFDHDMRPFCHSPPLKILISEISNHGTNYSTYSKKKSYFSKVTRDSIQVVNFPQILYKEILSASMICDALLSDEEEEGGEASTTSTQSCSKRTVDDDTDGNVSLPLIKRHMSGRKNSQSESLQLTDTSDYVYNSTDYGVDSSNTIDSTEYEYVQYSSPLRDVEIACKTSSLKECIFKFASSSISRMNNNEETDADSSHFEEDLEENFKLISAHVQKTDLPPSWGFTFTDQKCAIFINWNDSFNYIQKQVMISPNYEIKVLIHQRLMDITDSDCINGYKGLTSLLKKIDSIQLCAGFSHGTMRSDKCLGFVSCAYQRPIKEICYFCIYEKNKWSSRANRIEDLKKQLKERTRRCKELTKENSVLCQQVESCYGVQFTSEVTELSVNEIGI